MEHFTPIASLLGGLLIGGAAALLLLGNGRIAGVSGIAAGLITRQPEQRVWRGLFLAGLLVGAAVASAVGMAPIVTIGADWPVTVVGGLIVGFGTRLGGGCTSGHGVCGLARLSPRSLAATAIFMATGMVTVFVIRHVIPPLIGG
jgi:uncharacterized membrane protein YedE/YeeE